MKESGKIRIERRVWEEEKEEEEEQKAEEEEQEEGERNKVI